MLRHVIPPSSRYTKASNDVVRHARLNSDAKILLLYVQGLPGDERCRPLGELARRARITGRAYQVAKSGLKEHGYLHEVRCQGEGGRWTTRQLLANVPLSPEEGSRRLRESPADAWVPPGAHFPAVGRPGGRSAGGQLPGEDDRDKTTPHPPPEAGEPQRAVPQDAVPQRAVPQDAGDRPGRSDCPDVPEFPWLTEKDRAWLEDPSACDRGGTGDTEWYAARESGTAVPDPDTGPVAGEPEAGQTVAGEPEAMGPVAGESEAVGLKTVGRVTSDAPPPAACDPAEATPEPTAPAQAPASPSDPAHERRLRTAARVLLSLRRARRELHLGEREAHALAPEAAEWLARGMTEDDLRHALLAERPHDGVRSAVGFLRHRLIQKLPEPRHTPAPPPAPLPRQPLRTCTAPGDEHLFRPHGDETRCPDCHPHPTPAPTTDHTPDFPETATWRERFTIVAEQDARRQ